MSKRDIYYFWGKIDVRICMLTHYFIISDFKKSRYFIIKNRKNKKNNNLKAIKIEFLLKLQF